MTTTTDSPLPSVSTTMSTTAPARDAARVSFVPPGAGRHRLDGAWWPRSRDLRSELPALVAELDARFGRIRHLTVNRSMWPEIPRRVPVAGRVMHVGWFGTEQDPHEICVLASQAGRWDLLIVPPESTPEAAARMMAAAGAPHNMLSASALLAADALTVSADSEGPAGSEGSAGSEAAARGGVPT